jgi:hypothetical protein
MHMQLPRLETVQPYVPWWIVWEHDPQARHHRVEVELSYALGRSYWARAMPPKPAGR